MLQGIFRTKSLDEILASIGGPQISLKRTLTAFSVTLIGIGAIIGAGIFATVGTAASGTAERAGAGPSLMLSFVITAIVCGFTALCYAELASMVPISGSAYTYSYATFGELVAWIIGWDLIIEYAIGNVAVAISWAEFFNRLLRNLGIHVPDWLTSNYRTASEETLAAAPHIVGFPIVFNVFAFGIVALITIVLVWGIKESSNFNAIMVLIKILVLLVLRRIGALLRLAGTDDGELETIPAPGMDGNTDRSSSSLLCLHRVRRGEYRCGGNEESRQRSAHRNHCFAHNLHDSLHYCCRNVHRHGAVGDDSWLDVRATR